MKRTLSALMAMVLLVCMLPISVFAADMQTTPMYRLYNPNSGEHFYTGSAEEKDNLVAAGWNYEGIAWNAPTQSGDPVYRLYNPNSGDHHYTMSAQERDMLVGYGWQYEGVCWNSVSANDPAAVPLFRLYNPNADCGSHHYTTSAEERDNLVAVGWILEGIGWFGAGNHVHSFQGGFCTGCGEAEVAEPSVEVKLSLDQDYIEMDTGDTVTIKATYSGSTGSPSWSSSDSSVATVSDGKVTAKGAGTATITATYGGETATCTVTVNKPAAEVTLKLNKRLLELYVGETATLKATYTGSGSLTWSSSDTSVVTVDSNGNVTAKGAGSAVVSVTDGTKTAQCMFDVYAAESSEPEIGPAAYVWKSGNDGSWEFGCVGNELSFHSAGRTAEGEDGENMQVTAFSSDTGVATVSVKSNGNTSIVTVSFIKTGSVTITLTSVDGNASTSFTISVRGYSAQNASTPEAFAAAATYVMNMNGCNTSAGGTYTVLTLSDSELSWSGAVGVGQSTASRAWTNGSRSGSVTYEGLNEDGLHVFYLRSS